MSFYFIKLTRQSIRVVFNLNFGITSWNVLKHNWIWKLQRKCLLHRGCKNEIKEKLFYTRYENLWIWLVKEGICGWKIWKSRFSGYEKSDRVVLCFWRWTVNWWELFELRVDLTGVDKGGNAEASSSANDLWEYP